MANKLFGNSSHSKFSSKGRSPEKSTPSSKEKKRSRLKPLKIILILVLVLEILYCVAIFSNIPFIVKLRNIYIETALSTKDHQWLATALIPKDIIDEVIEGRNQVLAEQMGLTSSWADVKKPTESTVPVTGETVPSEETEPPASQEQIDFFELYWELDQESMLDYVKQHPEVLENGWDEIYINEAGLDDEGTTIRTTMDEQVLAIDAKNKLLLVRVTGSDLFNYRGILAIGKDPSLLRLGMSKGLGSYGQHAGDIAEHNGAVIAITASGFHDDGGGGNGGDIAGHCMSEGEAHYGVPFKWGYKRAELREDNRLYITDTSSRFRDDVTDAAEFWPALIIDGKNALSSNHFFTETNPRSCIGQSIREEILLLVIEGRLVSSAGCDADECVEILLRHDCYQAMNMDGGTSAIMWYDGEYVTRCSNTRLPEGRYLPNAWIYGTSE